MTGLAGIQKLHRSAEDRQVEVGLEAQAAEAARRRLKGAKVTWKLQTNLGDIAVALLPEVAPRHVTSTVYLTQLGFYGRRRVPPRDPGIHGEAAIRPAPA